MALKVLIASNWPSPTQTSITLGREIPVALDGTSNKQYALFPLHQLSSPEGLLTGSDAVTEAPCCKGWLGGMYTHSSSPRWSD